MNPYTLIDNLGQEIKIPETGMLSHTLYNDDDLKIILFGFSTGHELAAHTAPVPATMMFIEGNASVTLGNDAQHAGPGALIHMQPKLRHGVVAKSPVLMLLYLHKSARQQN